MPPSKRSRACDTCHSIKIKCELGSSNISPPCGRCLRLGKDCTVSAPVRQKDRVAELEAKLEALTKLLEAQQIHVSVDGIESLNTPSLSSTSTPKSTVQETSSKKRRLDTAAPNGQFSEKIDENSRAPIRVLEIDHLIPRDIQMQAFDKFCTEMEPRFPLASLAVKSDYETLRESCPVLLQTVIFAASPGKVSNQVQVSVTEVVMALFAPNGAANAEKSLAMIQALQVAAFWYRPPRNYIQIPLGFLAQQALSISVDIGLDKLNSPMSSSLQLIGQNISPTDAWRTYFLNFLLCASLGVCMRTHHQVFWNEQDDSKLVTLEYANEYPSHYIKGTGGLDSDKLLSQFVRAERLCDQIASDAGFYDFKSVSEVSDMHHSVNHITDWKAQIPPSWLRDNLVLQIYEQISIVFLHECILHTPTNKQSFAAPYVSERLSVTDFPAPIALHVHATLLHALKDAIHTILNLFTSFDVKELMFIPTLLNSRAAYAQWILVKLYVATTAKGNTYGALIDAQSLEVEHYLGKMIQAGQRFTDVDVGCATGHVVMVSKRLKDWVSNYKASHVYQGNFTSNFSDLIPLDSKNIDWTQFPLANDSFQYGLDELFGEFEYGGGVWQPGT